LLGQAADAVALVHAQRAHARSAGFTPGKHRGGMELAARHSAVATRVAATGLDLVDRAFDQIADLKNLPQLAAILRRQVTKDLSLVVRRHREHTRAHSWLWSQSRHRVKLTSVTMHFHGTRFLFGSPEKNVGDANFYSHRAAPCVRRSQKRSDSDRYHCARRAELRSMPWLRLCTIGTS